MAAADDRAAESKDDGRVVGWLESLLDGQVVAWQRQPRWRPMWFADVDRGGTTERVVVRGERSDTSLIFPLEHEMLFQRLLDSRGIPVPRVHGWWSTSTCRRSRASTSCQPGRSRPQAWSQGRRRATAR